MWYAMDATLITVTMSANPIAVAAKLSQVLGIDVSLFVIINTIHVGEGQDEK